MSVLIDLFAMAGAAQHENSIVLLRHALIELGIDPEPLNLHIELNNCFSPSRTWTNVSIVATLPNNKIERYDAILTARHSRVTAAEIASRIPGWKPK